MKKLKIQRKPTLLRMALATLVVAIVLGFCYMDFTRFGKQEPINQHAVVDMIQKHVFEPVLPDTAVTLPSDFRFHPDYQHEWWQYFANVEDEEGLQYAVQWSYFRIASDERKMVGWQNPQVYISHIVVSNETQIWKEQRMARGGIGQAGMTINPFRLWIDNWNWESLGTTPFPGDLNVATNEFSLKLHNQMIGPFALLGDNGYQPKHDLLPIAAFNISAPFLSVSGEMNLDGNKLIRVKGSAWMSKEWSSQLISQRQKGWDWFVIELNKSETLTISRYRHQDQMPYLFGSIISKTGNTIALSEDQISLKAMKSQILDGGKRVPLEWNIVIPEYSIDLKVTAVNNNLQLPFLIPYWEGPINTTGSHQVQGFMQLTGY
ncbi:lipocalin-like domain-containing protein [Vibrio amylolyticus]|uniref:lipocalin-like domain-containing protein n=1 Tax=Vibrio amylolyticus TaxID=2847292 RepID=UPI00354B2E7F